MKSMTGLETSVSRAWYAIQLPHYFHKRRNHGTVEFRQNDMHRSSRYVRFVFRDARSN